MKDLFIVAWTGAYDPPQFDVTETDVDAWALAHKWADDMRGDGGERIDVLRINGGTLSIELLGTL